MIILVIFLFSVALVLGVGVLAGWSDIKGMRIPNLYSVIIVGVFFFCYAVMWLSGAGVFLSLWSHFLSAVIVFGISAAMFYYRIMGAGDSKLATAYALWLGLPGLIPFIFYMSVAGGVLGGCALLMKKYKPFQNPPEGSWMAQVQGGASKVPYGVAIVFGVFVSFGFLGYIHYETFVSILADVS